MKKYDPEDRLAISLIKQYCYCPRRFTLMCIDGAWASNYKIVEGDILHEKVDNPYFNEKRGTIHNSRSVPVFSDRLQIYGVADIVEFIQDADGVHVNGKFGTWRINPIEYKNGKPEESCADQYQLCAIALCLEEMFGCTIETGDIYYGKLRKRMTVKLSNPLRNAVETAISEMQTLIADNTILKKRSDQNCSQCSLSDICLPRAFDE